MAARLKTDRLILRPWTEADREPFRLLNADPRVMEFMPSVLTAAQSDSAFDRIQEHRRRHGFTLFAAELLQTGRMIGYIGLLVPSFEAHFTPCVEIGWRLDAEYWGRGLATEGARAALVYGFSTLGLQEVVSFTVSANLRSRRVMDKLGMTRDPVGDFDHPRLAEGHPLRRHVLYRLRAALPE